MPTGEATIDFGTTPKQMASVTVTGAVGIAADSLVEAFLMTSVNTADHSAYEHMMLAGKLGLVCGSINVGSESFIITGIIDQKLHGAVKVKWVWV